VRETPHTYLITDPKFYGSNPSELRSSLRNVLNTHHPDLVCYRDKETRDYARIARTFIQVCKEAGIQKILLHTHVDLAHELGADGVHLSSGQSDAIVYAKSLGLYVIISTHSQKEAETAVRNGADAITYSPIFSTPGKGKPKGLEDLKERVDKIGINIFALGGITSPGHVEAVARTGVYGFASIRYFLEN
jgi:thiamine-phosphate pyrophosphorylase